MKPSILGKQTLSAVLQSSGVLARRLKKAAGSGLLVLMYHRVVAGASARLMGQEGMYVEVETFEHHLRFLKRHFRVVLLEEGLHVLEQGSGGAASRDGKPHCAITFDDGWRDVYENAYPLLRSHGIAATVFLPTGFIGTPNRFWTDRLALLLSAGNPGIPDHTEGRELHGIIESMKQLPQDEIDRILQSMSEERGMDDGRGERAFLSWEEVGEMFRSGIVRFGSHTESHRILTGLSDDEVGTELHRSKERLVSEGVVDPAFVPFSYPNGNHTDRLAAMVCEAGYRLAVTTEKGWNRAKPAIDAYRMKRIGVHQDIASTEAMFGCRLVEMF